MASVQSQAELVDAFTKKWTGESKEIAVKLNNLSESQAPLANLNEIAEDLKSLSKVLHEASLFLPSYTKKMRQEELGGLAERLKKEEDRLIPKQKFGFKSKPRVVEDVKPCEEDPSPSSDPSSSVSSANLITPGDSNFVTIENLDNTTLTRSDQDVSKTDVLVRNLTNVVLHLHGSPSTLRIQNVKNCKILCGPVHTSVFVEGAVNCVLFLCCQQLRTHGSTDTDIYLRVRARAIIEDCDRIRFAPYVWDHPLSQKLHEATSMDPSLERFDAVDDFNWLIPSPSPHWTIIPQEERRAFPLL